MKLPALLILTTLCLSFNAQHIPEGFNLENQVYNPAFTATRINPSVQLNNLYYLPGTDRELLSFNAYGEGIVLGKIGLGGYFGNTILSKSLNRTEAGLNAAFSYRVTRRFSIRGGVGAMMQQSQLHTPFPGSYYSGSIAVPYQNSFHLNAGILGYSRNSYFGISAKNINQPTESSLGGQSPILWNGLFGRTFNLALDSASRNNKYSNQRVSLHTILRSDYSAKTDQLNEYMDVQLLAQWGYKKVAIRTGYTWRKDLPTSIDIGIGLSNYHNEVLYTTQLTSDPNAFISDHSGNYLSHQISWKFNFNTKPKKRSFRTISCPSFGSSPSYFYRANYGWLSGKRKVRAKFGGSGSYDNPELPQYSSSNTEEYDKITDNPFVRPTDHALSTFSIDVDNAAYSNMRRFVEQMDTLPPIDAVRIEEMLNYFDYEYPEPSEEPIEIFTETTPAPWNKDHQLLRIGLQATSGDFDTLPANNLVFLLDVSGSMESSNKLPLVKHSIKQLVENLREQDQVSIVVYAGSSGLVLPPTSGNEKSKIYKALDQLKAGGSTAGGEGIQLAYKTALEHFIEGGNNRVILATDGDFNVGMSSNGDMERLIESKRKSGVFLSTLGFGMGNYKDSKMEILADKGNGNYFYIDSKKESKKVMKQEMTGNLYAVAKDVKIQIEFNPNFVQAYRLIGYENRMLEAEDFNDDKKDAGEIGLGQSVTALYEIIPANEGLEDSLSTVTDLRYQRTSVKKKYKRKDELGFFQLRYKHPESDTSLLITKVISTDVLEEQQMSKDQKFAASIAGLGMHLRNSPYKGETDIKMITKLAEEGLQNDTYGYKKEFIELINSIEKIEKGKRTHKPEKKEKAKF